MPDTQITELAGRHYLISQLLAGGVEVAMPVRDKGIDLIAYLDHTEQGPAFFACPIQLKANEQQRLTLSTKYQNIANLLMVYAWKVSSTEPELYALTYAEAYSLLEAQQHTQTKSWTERGTYTLTANETWRTRLEVFRMHPAGWSAKITSACRANRSFSVQNTHL